jgi:hypothetical protein
VNATRKFFSGLVEARLVEDEIWAVTCKGIELGAIEHHRGDRDWRADRRWEIVGSRPERGFAGRLSNGFETLGGAVTVLCRYQSSVIISVLNSEGENQ